MNAIRRILILSVLTVAVIAGASVPARATYATSKALQATTTLTPTVEPPTQVGAKAVCTTTVNPTTGATTTVHLANGTSSVVAQTGPSGDEIYPDVTPAYLSQQPRYAMTTLTSHGGTAVSAKTGVLSC